jgi:DNA-binding NarL/FixJ family response regulator
VIKLLIVDDIASTRENLQKLLGFEDDIEVAGTAGDGRQALEEAHRLQPDIVLTDVNMPVMDGIQLTERLAQEMPTTPVIIMSVQGERDYLRRAMQAGAREYLIKPFSHDELVAAIHRVYELEQKKTATVAAKAPAAEPAAPQRTALGEVVMVFSGKGGVGKTLVATNLAVALASATKSRIALLDFDLQFGDVGVMLNLDHSRSITDVVDAGDQLDGEVLNDILATGPAGVRVLLAPISPELADLVTTEHVRRIMAELRKTYDYIVVDTSSQLAEFNLEVIEMAQRIVVDQGREALAQGARVAQRGSREHPACGEHRGQPLRLQPRFHRAEFAPPGFTAAAARCANRRGLNQSRCAVRRAASRRRHQPCDARSRRARRTGPARHRRGGWRRQAAAPRPVRPLSSAAASAARGASMVGPIARAEVESRPPRSGSGKRSWIRRS